MRIRRIEVKDFRKLGRATVEDLQDGLNVLVGDNEAGKSTLLAALRAGLFERHRIGGDVAAAMLPYNQLVRPEVTVEFELDNKHWRLRKAFCQRPEAELSGPGERQTGDAVEDRLAELFGFTPPSRGGSKPGEHQGVHGLLWVEQGRAHRALEVGGGRDAIASALEQEIGHVVGGERGRALLSSAEERRNAFWDKRGNVRGSLKALGEDVEVLRARRAELRSALSAQDEKVVQLAGKAEALTRHEEQGSLDQAVRSAQAARAAVAATDHLRAASTSAKDLLVRRRLEHACALDRQTTRLKLVADTETAREAVDSVAALLQGERENLIRRAAALKRAEATFAAARHASREAAAGVRLLDLARAWSQGAELLVSLNEKATTVQAVDAIRRERLATAAAIALEATDVAELETLERDRDRTRLQLDVASVRLAFEPAPGRGVVVDGVAHEVGAPLFLARDAVLTLSGFGQVSIRPGGGIDALARKADAAARALMAKLAACGYDDVAPARSALAAKAEALREVATAVNTLRTLAPHGIGELLQAVSDQEVFLKRSTGEAIEWSQTALDAAVQVQAQAVELERDAEDAVSAERRADETADRAVAVQTERAAAAAREHIALAQALIASRADIADKDLTKVLTIAERLVIDAEDREKVAEAALAESDPEMIALETIRAEGAERSIRADIDILKRDKRDLEIELRALGRDGLGEQLAEVEEQLASEERRLAAQGTQARAARLLHDTLAQAQRDTRDRWFGPVRERAAPYLRLVQPDTDIVLNESTLEIESLVRGGIREPFAGLSVGAREQVAVITRLALADILRGANRPSAIILDDALVNTDERRLHQMHLVLQRAAQTMQVIILTCRERDFVQLGAPIKRL